MKKLKVSENILSFIIISAIAVIVSSCISDQSVAKKRGLVKDFTVNPTAGCGESFLNYVSPYDTCVSECSPGTTTVAGFHLASLEELSEVKKELVDNGNTSVLNTVNGSANVCIADVLKEERPTNAIDIKSDFCSCLKGKPDILGNCASFCASKTVTDQPVLYVNTILNAELALNSKLNTLHKWCTVQLPNDETTPQCSVIAYDGTNTLTLPVNTAAGSNSFNVNILSLTPNRTWIIKIAETKTGSEAQSKEFQIRREAQPVDNGSLGALKIAPISQYTCMTYGGKVDALGNIIRTTYARIFYYFEAGVDPLPIAPAGGANQSQVVCHDEQLHPGNDSSLYPRLELIPGSFSMWSRSDVRFVQKAENNNKPTINKILTDRLFNEYNVTSTGIDLFRLFNYPNKPTTSTSASVNIPLGYVMIPFTDDSGKSYCPTSVHFNGSDPLLNILGEYIDDTEALYLAEKEGETVLDGTTYKTLYGTMFVRESTLKSYGFYVENGLKIKINSASMNNKTIHFYWPASATADPLIAGNRKLFTVRTADTLNGNVPTTQSTVEPTSDKRIGCVPKISN